MSFAAYISSVYTLMGLAGLAVTCAFAWWKGGTPERLGTLMLAVSWVGADLVRGLSGQMVPTVTLLISDILISAGFLYIAIRYSSLWLGAAMMFRAVGFAVHAAQLSATDAPRWNGWIIYLLINNVLSYLVLLTLAGGTLATMMRRRRQALAKVAAEAKAAGRSGLVRVPPQPPAAAI
jgi:nitrate reductase gamma subunit